MVMMMMMMMMMPMLMMMMMVMMMMMMMMMMRCLSWLRFRAKPRHLLYIYIQSIHEYVEIHIYICQQSVFSSFLQCHLVDHWQQKSTRWNGRNPTCSSTNSLSKERMSCRRVMFFMVELRKVQIPMTHLPLDSILNPHCCGGRPRIIWLSRSDHTYTG